MSDQLKSVKDSIATEVKAIQEPFKLAFGKPSQVKDYVRVFDTYISKQIIIRALIIAVIAGIAVKTILLPYLEGKLWIPTIVINTPKYHTYTGAAKVVSEEGEVIYKGAMESGIVTGFGELFDSGFVVYQGEFVNNAFYGSGKLYYSDDIIKYEGLFENNQYRKGTLYYEDGSPQYSGVFKESGMYDEGTLYYEDGGLWYEGLFGESNQYINGRLYNDDETLIYEGVFESGTYKNGSLYYEEGWLKYSGEFSNGLYDGVGKEYSSEKIVYDGSFKEGLYEGYGKLYDNGMLLYEGSFVKELYSGMGSLYSNGGGQAVYTGGFWEGLYSGEGVLYSGLGKELFRGMFYKGEINYSEFTDKKVQYLREAFGNERRLIMMENSFLLVYEDLNVIFELSFADEENEPTVQRIKLLGQQNFLNVKKGMSVDDFRELFNEDIFTEYFFYVDDEAEIPFSYADEAIREGDEVYCIKYNLESIYIRAFFNNETGNVIYYEIGGI